MSTVLMVMLKVALERLGSRSRVFQGAAAAQVGVGSLHAALAGLA